MLICGMESRSAGVALMRRNCYLWNVAGSAYAGAISSETPNPEYNPHR